MTHKTPAETYYRLRDEHIAAGGIVPQNIRTAATDGRYDEAIAWLTTARHSDFRDITAPVVTTDNPNADLAAALHDLADKIAAYTGPLPKRLHLHAHFVTYTATRDQVTVDNVDALATALFGHPGADRVDGPISEHRADVTDRGLYVKVYTYVPAPADEQGGAA